MSLMMQELLTAPEVVRQVIENNKTVVKNIAEEFKKRGLTNITTVARGSSDNAATYFKYLSEIIAGVMVSKYTPSITTVYCQGTRLYSNMLLAISQSGQSTDTLMVVEDAKRRGTMTVAVTNDPQSPLAKLADFNVDLSAGPEASVSATKTFIAELAALYMIANQIAPKTAKMNLKEIPSVLEKFIAAENNNLLKLASETKDLNNIIVLTRGLMQGIASETSLKLMETCYKMTRPFSTADFMHGPFAVVEEGTPVIILAPSGQFDDEFTDMVRRLSLLGARVVAFSDIKDVLDTAEFKMKMPSYYALTSPFVYAMAVQLYSAHMADVIGNNPDKPRNLKKVIITK